MRGAADEIERLRAEIVRLEAMKQEMKRPRNGLAFGLSNKALVSIPAQGD